MEVRVVQIDKQNVVQHGRGHRGAGTWRLRQIGRPEAGLGRCCRRGRHGVICTESLPCQGGLHVCLLTTNIQFLFDPCDNLWARGIAAFTQKMGK